MNQQQPRRSGLPPADLAGAFGRSSGLSARLGPGRPRPPRDSDADTPEPVPEHQVPPTKVDVDAATSEQPPTADAAAGESAEETRSDAPDDAAQQSSQEPSEDASGARGARDRRGAVVIYTSTALRSRIGDYLEQTNARNADLLFDAFEATADELPQLWSSSLRGPRAETRSLFDRGGTPQRAGTEPQVGWYVAMSPANQGVLDDVVRQVTGGSSRKRSALAVLALTSFLDRWDSERS